MNGIIFCVCLTLAIAVLPIVLKRCRKERKKMQVEKESTAKSKPMMNLVSRYRVRDPNVLASTASESPSKTESESQEVPLSSWDEQQPRTGRPVMGSISTKTSQNGTLTTSGLLKSGNLVKCWEQERGDPWVDKFVIDDDMDSDTATESNLFLRSRSFLNRVNDRLRKMLDCSPEDAKQDIDKHSLLW